MKTLSTLTAAAFFALLSSAASATELSGLEYEDYAQSSTWPTETYFNQVSSPSVANFTQMIETHPTAAGGDIVNVDLMGDDIHSK